MLCNQIWKVKSYMTGNCICLGSKKYWKNLWMIRLLNLNVTENGRNIAQKFETIKFKVKLLKDCLVIVDLVGIQFDTQVHIRIFQPFSSTTLHIGKTIWKSHPRKYASTGWSTTKTILSWNNNKGLIP